MKRFALFIAFSALVFASACAVAAEEAPEASAFPGADEATETAAPVDADAPEADGSFKMADARENVWWGNRSISYGNYIRFDRQAPCIGKCKYCDKNMIDCETGCPCPECEYICEDCDNCPPTYFDKIRFDQKKSVLRPDAMQECLKIAQYLQANPEVDLVIESDLVNNPAVGLGRAETVQRCLIENGVSPERINILSYGQGQTAALPSGRRSVVVVIAE